MVKRLLCFLLAFSMLFSLGCSCSKKAKLGDITKIIKEQKVGKADTTIKYGEKDGVEAFTLRIEELRNNEDSDFKFNTKISTGGEDSGVDIKVGLDIKKRKDKIQIGLNRLLKPIAKLTNSDEFEAESNRDYYFSLSKLVNSTSKDKEDIYKKINENKEGLEKIIANYEPLYLTKSNGGFSYKANTEELTKEGLNFLEYMKKNKENFFESISKISDEEVTEEKKKEFYKDLEDPENAQKIKEAFKNVVSFEAHINKNNTDIVIVKKAMSPSDNNTEGEEKPEVLKGETKLSINSRWNDRLSVDLTEFKGDEMSDDEMQGLLMLLGLGIMGSLSNFMK